MGDEPNVARQVEWMPPETEDESVDLATLDKLPALTAETIFEADDIVIEPLAVPEWGGKVYVRSLRNHEREAWEQAASDQSSGDPKNPRVKLAGLKGRLVVLATCDEAGKPLFSMRQLAQLQQKNAAPLNRIFRKAKALSGIGDDEIEELAKNSSGGPDADSGFGLPPD